MSTDKCTPYGVKTLLECLSRATLLAQPDDIPEFLSKHVGKIAQSRDNESRDIKEVAFQYQEQWENTVLAKERKRKATQRPAQEESSSSIPSVCSSVSPPCEVRQRTCRVSSVRIPSREDSVGEKISPSSEPRPVPPPPRKETVKTCRVSSVRIPHQEDGVGLTTEETSFSREPGPVLRPPPPCVERVKTLQVSSVRIPSQEEGVGLTTEEISLSREPRPVLRPPPPRVERVKTLKVSSLRIPSQEGSVGLITEKKSSSSETRPVLQPPPPHGERVKTHRDSSVRIPHQKETKPSLPSAFPVLPPIPQKALSQVSKQVQGQKSTKGRRNREYACRLSDCPYHNKPKEEPQVERELEAVRSSTLPTIKFENSSAGLRISEIHIPYRPKGGPILDPELVPKRTRAGTMTNRRTGAESNLLHSRQDTAYSRRGTMSWGTKNLDLSQESLECAIHTLPHLAHSVHIIRYRRTRVHCNELQPQSARLPDIDVAPYLQQVPRNSTPSDCSRSSSAMSNLPSSHFSYRKYSK